jgi:hypothetical protein
MAMQFGQHNNENFASYYYQGYRPSIVESLVRQLAEHMATISATQTSFINNFIAQQPTQALQEAARVLSSAATELSHTSIREQILGKLRLRKSADQDCEQLIAVYRERSNSVPDPSSGQIDPQTEFTT